jgi:hypothetical protein
VIIEFLGRIVPYLAHPLEIPHRIAQTDTGSRRRCHRTSRFTPPTAGPSNTSQPNCQAAGTRAWNCRGRLSNPSSIVLAWTNRRLPTGTAPNSAVYSPVMSAAPDVGTGQVPMMRKLRHARTAGFCGGLVRSTVF